MRLKPYLTLAGLSSAILVVNDVPLGGPIPAILLTSALLLLGQRYAHYLLIVISLIQDTRNIGPESSYILFAGGAMLVFWRAVAHERGGIIADEWRRVSGTYAFLVMAAIAVVGYGFLTSMSYHVFGIFVHQFSLDRPYWIVAPTMLVMLLAAAASTKLIATDPHGSGRLLVAAALGIAHCFVIALIQIWLGQEWIRNPETLGSFAESADTAVATALGIPRLNATFASPNSLAAAVALMSLFLIAGRRHGSISRQEIFLFVFSGILISTATFSKSSAIFYAFGVIFLVARKPQYVIAAAGLLSVTAIGVTMADLVDPILTSFRLVDLDSSLRAEVWQATLDRFQAYQWLLGTGYSFWRQFFSDVIGYPLGEPHSYFLSIPGTFGIVGLLFYAWLLFVLLRAYRNTESVRVKMAAFLLIGYIFVRESVTEQSVLGRTVFSYWLWLAIGMTLVAAKRTALSTSRAPIPKWQGNPESA